MLNLHSGGEEVSFEALRAVPVPAATATHHPIAHYRLVDAVRNTLRNYGHEVIEEHHAIDKDGARYFGLMQLKSEYGDYTDVCGLRNSSDKSFPVGLAFGGQVFVCSNLSFLGNHVIKRRHTAHAWRDMHGLLAELIEPLALERQKQHSAFERFKAALLAPMQADHAIMQLYRDGVLNQQRITEVAATYENPPHDWGDKTAWRLFNCVTHSLTGRVAENPNLTRQLHETLEGVCERIA